MFPYNVWDLLCIIRFIAEQVSCGAAHTACLVSTGEVLTWGKGLDGQLGLGNVESQISPQLVQFPSDSYDNSEFLFATSVSCGLNFTGLVTSKHKFLYH